MTVYYSFTARLYTTIAVLEITIMCSVVIITCTAQVVFPLVGLVALGWLLFVIGFGIETVEL